MILPAAGLLARFMPAAFNMTVANSTAIFPVAASSIGTSQADNLAGEQNNAVVDGTGNINWDFSRPYIVSVQSVRGRYHTYYLFRSH